MTISHTALVVAIYTRVSRTVSSRLTHVLVPSTWRRWVMCAIVSWVSDLFDAYVILSYLYSWTCVFLYDTDLSPTGYPKKTDGTVMSLPNVVPRKHCSTYSSKPSCCFVLCCCSRKTSRVILPVVRRSTGWPSYQTLPVFVSLETLLSTMTHPDMTLKGFILYRDESFHGVWDCQCSLQRVHFGLDSSEGIQVDWYDSSSVSG